MKIEKAIKMANLAEPGNVLNEELAIMLLSELDGMIQTDIMLCSPQEIVEYDSVENELLLKPPHDKLYVHYLVMMIRQYQQEFEGYNNAQMIVNEKLEAFQEWYVAHYNPAETGDRSYIGAPAADPAYGFAYITAYGLAVQQGYQGTLEEWLASLKGEPGEAARMRYDADREMIQWGVGEAWYDLFTLAQLRDPAVEAIIGQAQTAASQAEQAMERAGLSAQVAKGSAEAAEQAAEVTANAAVDAARGADEAGNAAANAAAAEQNANRAYEETDRLAKSVAVLEESASRHANDAYNSAAEANAAAKRAEEAAAGAGQNPTQGGLTTAQVHALEGVLRIVKYESDPTGAFAAFYDAFGIVAKVLVSISATYDGGEVAVGTALTELDGITVTATYSDGSAEAVIGYTLTGEIAEGNNTITVSYGGKTATITVVGVASGDGPGNALYGRFWPPLSQITSWDNPEWVGVEGAVYTDYSGPYIDAGFPEAHMVRMADKLEGTVYIRTLTNNQYGTLGYSYKVYANSDGEVATGGFTAVTPVIHRNLGQLDVNGTMYDFVLYEFNIPAGQVGRFAALQAPMKSGYFVSADKKQIDEAYRPYYTLFDSDPRDRITEPATEVA